MVLFSGILTKFANLLKITYLKREENILSFFLLGFFNLFVFFPFKGVAFYVFSLYICTMKTKIDEKIENGIIADYTNGDGLADIASKYHLGKLKIKEILSENNIPLRARGELQIKERNFVVSDWKIEKYPIVDGYHYTAKAKDGSISFDDCNNKGGHLTTYIREKYGIETPSLYNRRIYYQTTGNYWWEQWFDIIKVENRKTKKCPYCEWETIDVENKSGVFEQHLKEKHQKNKEDYLNEYPEDIEYFKLVNPTKNLQMERDFSRFVCCEICGKKLARIDYRHLSKHGITKAQYIERFGKPTVSEKLHSALSSIATEVNKTMTFHKESNAEKELKSLIESWGIVVTKNRTILNGEEIDLFLPEYNLGIEYNGDFYHTDWNFGKTKFYHVSKTNKCESQNIRLIQVFEDEYMKNKDLVIAKIRHILGISKLARIMARKCTINQINASSAEVFLNKNHIQGYVKATVYLGAFLNNELISVMTFRKTNEDWELTRFATDIRFVCPGIGSKLFKYFIKLYSPKIVKSFADRRWTSLLGSNFYSSIGFNLEKVLPPDYKYYNQKVDKYKRIHKFNFRKQILHRKYGFPLTMTETEMAKELGYDRIWDCGLLKYVWRNTENAPN